jgi:hypothetical protein
MKQRKLKHTQVLERRRIQKKKQGQRYLQQQSPKIDCRHAFLYRRGTLVYI